MPAPPAGYSGWGGGVGPQGLSNTPGLPGNLTGVQATKNQLIGGTVNMSFYVVAGSGQSLIPIRAPSIKVPPGCTVLIRAHNGTSGGNGGLVLLSQHPEMVLQGDPLTPDSEITWPTDDTTQIWMAAQTNDGIRVSIQRQR